MKVITSTKGEYIVFLEEEDIINDLPPSTRSVNISVLIAPKEITSNKEFMECYWPVLSISNTKIYLY